MRKTLTAVFLVLAGVPAIFASHSPSMSPSAQSPQDQSINQYNDGLHYRDRAWKAEKELLTTQDSARVATLNEIIRKSYDADIRSQRSAINSDPRMFQAHTELGYALRKRGDYEGSLKSYDTALALMPNYAEALEYRAEAYLAINRVGEAKETYMLLYNGGDHERSQLLGGAMQKWVTERQKDPGAVAPNLIEEMAKWVAQRSEINKQTGTAGSGGSWR